MDEHKERVCACCELYGFECVWVLDGFDPILSTLPLFTGLIQGKYWDMGIVARCCLNHSLLFWIVDK